MGKINKQITVLTVGDRADYDSFKKFHKEKNLILESGFEYVTTSYKKLLTKGAPRIETEKVIIFLFFPFYYWNKNIEHKNYKGIYGSKAFYRKFIHFWGKVDSTIRKSLRGKSVFFANPPQLCGLYRDKLKVLKKFSQAGIPTPRSYRISRTSQIENLLGKGQSFFLKPRYGSMGKGITFLGLSNWKTNFVFKNNKIISRKSDRGWKFRDITGNRKFLSKLIKKDILIEQAINSMLFKNMKIDMRIYTFFNKVLYVYPRRNKVSRITTNISQGAKGDSSILKKIPKHLVRKAKKIAENAPKALGLNLAGMDVMVDRNLKDLYVVDVNLFPGFPKRRTFKLARYVIEELARLNRKSKLCYEKIYGI